MTPQKDNLKIEFSCQFRPTLPDVRLSSLLTTFTALLPTLLADFIQKALVGCGELLMAPPKSRFLVDNAEMMSISSGRRAVASRRRF